MQYIICLACLGLPRGLHSGLAALVSMDWKVYWKSVPVISVVWCGSTRVTHCTGFEVKLKASNWKGKSHRLVAVTLPPMYVGCLLCAKNTERGWYCSNNTFQLSVITQSLYLFLYIYNNF